MGMKLKILEITTGMFHPSIIARRNLHRYLNELDDFEIEQSSSIESVLRLKDENFQALIIYLHRQKISDDAISALDSFISGGGGLLGLHSASASFKTSPGYFEILGGKFLTHDKVMDFTITPVKAEPDIFNSINEFTVHDELYIHETKNDIQIHFYSEHNSSREPIVWTRNHNQGRVCYYEPGHCAPSLMKPESKKIILQGLKWVCRMI